VMCYGAVWVSELDLGGVRDGEVWVLEFQCPARRIGAEILDPSVVCKAL